MLYLVEFLPTDNSKIRQEEHRVRGKDHGTEFKHMVDALGCTFTLEEKLQKRGDMLERTNENLKSGKGI